MSMLNRLILGLILAQCVWLAGCTNSTFVHKRLYNHMDNHLMADVNRFVSLDDTQKKAISSSVQQFQHWHRTSQLPMYADFLLVVSEIFGSGRTIQGEKIVGWIDQVDHFTRSVKTCLPLNSIEPALHSLSQAQLSELMTNIKEKRISLKQRQGKLSEDEVTEKRYRGIRKWLTQAYRTPL